SGGWAGAQNDGFFLFKYIPGDFQVAVHIVRYDIAAFNEVGLMARVYSTGTNGTDLGAPFVLGPPNGETWVGFTKFDENFGGPGIGTYARKNINNAEFQFTQPGNGSPDNWLMIVRQNGTNFYFYERATNNAPWHVTPNRTSFSPDGAGALLDFVGQPMQVGIQVTPYTANPLSGQFEHFLLDVPNSQLQLKIVNNGNGT